jgi:ABC-type antimicrobial peptide transport system permease subunit
VTFRIVGFLKDSVFQSELVIGDAAFRKAFPRTEGFSYFLIDCQTQDANKVADLYAIGLRAHGLETTPSADRVSSYLAVQNTYLSTFQLLGGFGLLLGVMGMAIVLLRNVWERRSELALCRALGYRTRTLNRLTFVENAVLLLFGLGIGIGAALAAVAPHIAGGGQLPWGRLVPMLGGTLLVGLIASAVAVVRSARVPVVQALRHE